MAAPLTNFRSNKEDLADIYVDQTTVIEGMNNGNLKEEWLSQSGYDAVIRNSLWAWGEIITAD
jgi:hypothetical protein